MYDELIKRLPLHSLEIKARHPVISREIAQAADAIEQLLAETERLRLEVKHLDYLLRFK